MNFVENVVNIGLIPLINQFDCFFSKLIQLIKVGTSQEGGASGGLSLQEIE